MTSVVIIQRVLPHYRVPFFVGLREALEQRDIELTLLYGQEFPGTVPVSAGLDAPWAQKIENRYFDLMGIELVWQPCLSHLKSADMVIVEQANRLLVNYILLLLRRIGKPYKLAYWGHGRHTKVSTEQGWRDSIKRMLSNFVDWWFAYTLKSAESVIAGGYPGNRTTVVQNTISTSELHQALQSVSITQIEKIRSEFGIEKNDRVCIFCGGMNAGKKLDFLIDACKSVRARLPDFHLLLLGDGPEKHKAEAAAAHLSWVHYIGPVYGPDRVVYFKLGLALLMPGLVGLITVDSFVTQTPMFTTDLPDHGPEIAYLENGVNGVMTDYNVDSYADTVVAYLEDSSVQKKLKSGCKRSAQLYTLENMIGNFASGIQSCLSTDR